MALFWGPATYPEIRISSFLDLGPEKGLGAKAPELGTLKRRSRRDGVFVFARDEYGRGPAGTPISPVD